MLTAQKAVRIIIVALTLVSATATAETTIGRWCDRWAPNQKSHRIMTITLSDDGTIMLTSKFGDGSSLVDKLRERPNGILEKIGSPYGDKVRIVPSDGNLQLFDRDGLIRVAARLENTARQGECSR